MLGKAWTCGACFALTGSHEVVPGRLMSVFFRGRPLRVTTPPMIGGFGPMNANLAGDG